MHFIRFPVMVATEELFIAGKNLFVFRLFVVVAVVVGFLFLFCFVLFFVLLFCCCCFFNDNLGIERRLLRFKRLQTTSSKQTQMMS